MSNHYYEMIRGLRPHDERDQVTKNNMLAFIIRHQDDVLYRDNAIAHMTASSVIINESRDKMLMIHHKIYDTWTWQGGHADGEGDLLKVALKEAQEETGLTDFKVLEDEGGMIIGLDILTVREHIKNGKYISAHLHLNAAFLFEAREEDILFLNEQETNGVRWVPFEDIDIFADEPEITPIYHKLISRGVK
ncbi:NUDIX hydrolase [Proteiniclasticum sp.]|uniref:NUDIX hydrolase n=1 Tax=Proteiniclasticum sp. TaxID=2053595 RepID=UPI00289F901F|nr:NUDIX hydrolase [Proteiniclasticum sp.]